MYHSNITTILPYFEGRKFVVCTRISAVYLQMFIMTHYQNLNLGVIVSITGLDPLKLNDLGILEMLMGSLEHCKTFSVFFL